MRAFWNLRLWTWILFVLLRHSFSVTIGCGIWSNIYIYIYIYITDPWHPLPSLRLNERTKSPSGGRWLIGSPSGSNATFATPFLLGKLPFHLVALRLSPRTFNGCRGRQTRHIGFHLKESRIVHTIKSCGKISQPPHTKCLSMSLALNLMTAVLYELALTFSIL